ncbi:MAG: nitroreductase [Enterocloster asparagiformis]|nr:nitroreductase [Enterocloster asparagiformis]
MNECIENMKQRRSVKRYDPSRGVEPEKLEQILEAGMYAPSGYGKQSPRIVVVQDRETRDLLSRLNARFLGKDIDPFYGAPTILVVLADRAQPTYLYDGALVMGNLLNAAHALGVDSCWVHRAKEVFSCPEGRELLTKWGLEEDYEGIGHCLLGYGAAPAPKAGPRKDGYVVYPGPRQ